MYLLFTVYKFACVFLNPFMKLAKFESVVNPSLQCEQGTGRGLLLTEAGGKSH